MISLTALIIGVILFIAYVKKNTIKIDKTDPENIQLIMDLKQLQLKAKKWL